MKKTKYKKFRCRNTANRHKHQQYACMRSGKDQVIVPIFASSEGIEGANTVEQSPLYCAGGGGLPEIKLRGGYIPIQIKRKLDTKYKRIAVQNKAAFKVKNAGVTKERI